MREKKERDEMQGGRGTRRNTEERGDEKEWNKKERKGEERS